MTYTPSEQRMIRHRARELLGVVQESSPPENNVAAENDDSVKEALADNDDVLKAPDNLASKIDYSEKEALVENKALLNDILKALPELTNLITNLSNVIEEQAQFTRDADLQNVLLLVQALTCNKKIVHDQDGHPVGLVVEGS